MKQIDDLLTMRIGSPVRHRALSVYPLTPAEASAAPSYLVLDDALATGRFRITEVSESGSVPRLLAINETDRPVFLLDGEELIGAKQNRVLNLSLMLAPNSKTEIPVSCVEAGRWRSESRTFQAARVQFARGRAQKMAHVSRSLWSTGEASSDQTAVWSAIAAKSARMAVDSPTAAMSALFDTYRDDLQDYLDAIPTQDGQAGAVYAIGDSLVGVDIFDSDMTFKKLAGKLLASYALDAMECVSPSEPPDISAVQGFIASVGAAARQPATAVGMGLSVRLAASDLVGAALDVAGGCVHLAAFRRNDAKDPAGPDVPNVRMSRSSRRAWRW